MELLCELVLELVFALVFAIVFALVLVLVFALDVDVFLIVLVVEFDAAALASTFKDLDLQALRGDVLFLVVVREVVFVELFFGLVCEVVVDFEELFFELV